MNNILMKVIDALIVFVGNQKANAMRSHYKRKLRVKKLDVYFPIFISNTKNINLGENCSIAPYVQIWANEKVMIGENSAIAAHVQITTSTHDYHHRPYRDKRVDIPVIIGKNVWIGGGAVILPGVTIGDNAVVGAGSVVTKDIPENCLAYGVPAKIIKHLQRDGVNDSALDGS